MHPLMLAGARFYADRLLPTDRGSSLIHQE
jgi:hypothetical protein